MSYTKTNWVDDSTPLNDDNLNKIENGIADVDSRLTTAETALSGKANTADLATVATSGNYKDLTSKLVREHYSIDNISITKNSISGEKEKSIAKTGYTPIGLVGQWIDNATSSGTNCTWCNMYYCVLNTSTQKVTVNIKNFNTSASAKVEAHFVVLYAPSA